MRERLANGFASIAGNSLVRNSFALISGTVVTQAIVLLFSPFLSRIFGLADFGNLANYNAWVSILALVSSLRYEHAIIIAPDARTTNQVVALTAALCLVFFVLYGAAAGIIHVLGASAGYLEHVRHIVPFIPIGVLGICLSSPLIQLNVKAGNFRRVAMIGVQQIAITIAVQILLGIGGVAHALIVGTIVGYVYSGAALGVLTFREHRLSRLLREATLPRLRATAIRYIDFPRYTLPADAINVVVQQFGPVFVLALFNPAVAGVYSFALRIVRVPVLVVSAAVSSALRREALDHLRSTGALRALFNTTYRSLFLVALVPFVIGMLYGPQLFAMLFGQQWTVAGRVVQILGPGILLEFVALPLGVFFLVTQTQRFTFWIQIAGFAMLLAALWMGRYVLGDFIGACYLISGAMVLTHLSSIVMARQVSGGDAAPHVSTPDNGASLAENVRL